MIACPFNVPAFEYDEAVTPRIMKCTLCYPRIKEGLLPGCVAACPMEALSFGKRDDLIALARERIHRYPDRYIDHVYGEHEMGGTNWLYITSAPFEQLDFNTDLGTLPAPEFTAGALSLVPMVVGLWPVLLGGIYAVNKRKERIDRRERETELAQLKAEDEKVLKGKIAETEEMMKKRQEKAVEKAVKKAKEEAAQEGGKEEQS
jgi:hypothetical protein